MNLALLKSLDELLSKDATVETLSAHSALLSIYAEYYASLLKTDYQKKVLFNYLNDQQKKAYIKRWALTANIFLKKSQIDAAQSNSSAIEENKKIIDLCQEMSGLALLTDIECGIAIAAAMAAVNSLSEVHTSFTTEYLSKKLHLLNIRRFRWSFGNGILLNVVNALPKNFYNASHTRSVLNTPNRVVTYMTFILFYLRFLGHVALLLKHTIKGPWMSQEEQNLNIQWYDRMALQWQYRKHILINDFVQASTCVACLFWLMGALKTTLGYIGGLLSMLSTLVECLINIWRFTEEVTEHNKKLAELNQHLQDLDENTDKARIKDLQKMIAKEEAEINYSQQKQRRALIFTLCILTTAALLCCAFCPPIAAIPGAFLIFGLTGSSLSFAIGTVYNASIRLIDRKRTLNEIDNIKHETREFLLQEHVNYANMPLAEKRACFLEVQSLLARSAYQRALANHQLQELICGVFLDVLIPTLIFTSLMFMPFGVGIPVMVAGILLAALIQELVVTLKPLQLKPALTVGVDDEPFNRFNECMMSENFNNETLDKAIFLITEPKIPSQLSQHLTFFSSTKKQPEENLHKNNPLPGMGSTI